MEQIFLLVAFGLLKLTNVKRKSAVRSFIVVKTVNWSLLWEQKQKIICLYLEYL